MKKKITALLLCLLLLAACDTSAEEDATPSSSVAEAPVISISPPMPSHAPETPPAVEPMEYEALLLGPWKEPLAEEGINVTGSDFALDEAEHSFTFTLALERQGELREIPVAGTYAGHLDVDFAAATWGGISWLDEETLAVYTKGSIVFMTDTLWRHPVEPSLASYEESWVLGVCKAGEGYAAILASETESQLVTLNAAGTVVNALKIADPSFCRLSDYSYFMREERYTPGFAFEIYPEMTMMRFDSPGRDFALLQQGWHSAWMTDDGVGRLDQYLFIDPADGAVIHASEDYYHIAGDIRFAVSHYSSSDRENPTGYMGMYYENNERKAAIAFAGLPSYSSMGIEDAEWTVNGKRAEAVNPSGCQYITLDFESMTGSNEYRFTRENLEEEEALAVSSNGRYRLVGVNRSGAGDGYWGQVVLVDGESGDIRFVCNLPVRYGGDQASTNFSDDRVFTTADGGILNIHTVDTPHRKETVRLTLPGDDLNVIYCNSIYDAGNERYLLAYLDGVNVDSGGWHEYENAVYHVAVFDRDLVMTGEAAVPGLEVTHSLYAMPCPEMTWEGKTLLLGGVPVDLPQ